MSMTTTSGWSRCGILDALPAVGRFADDLDVGLVLEDHPEPGAHQLLVVDEEHADLAVMRRDLGRARPAGERER